MYENLIKFNEEEYTVTNEVLESILALLPDDIKYKWGYTCKECSSFHSKIEVIIA